MEIKEELPSTSFCSQSESEVFNTHFVTEVKCEPIGYAIEAETELKEEATFSDFYSPNETEHSLMLINAYNKDYDMHTKVEVKEEVCWSERISTEAISVYGEIKDGMDQDFSSSDSRLMAYIRKSTRGSWSEEALKEAATRVSAGEIGKREAERYYGIPARTICRRIQKGDFRKRAMGPEGVLGEANEKRLVAHIQRLAEVGFAPDRQSVRILAYKFAESLGLNHGFSREKEMAGYVWLNSFLRRNPELLIRQAEGLSVNRAKGMNRKEVATFFKLLKEVMEKNDLFDKPGHIFNVDETDFPLINKPAKVLTSKERGENITLIGCFNAEGTYIPPVLIIKGVNRKAEFTDGLPFGSSVYMNRKSSYISPELFLQWLKEQFIPRKPAGKTLLLLDDHASHTNCLELLECAERENVTILCLPSHTTQALQPLNRSFYGALKAYYKKEAAAWMRSHSERSITRYQVGQLIGAAWNKAASVGNAISGFRECGIFPLNLNAIPEYFYSSSDSMLPTESIQDANFVEGEHSEENERNTPSNSTPNHSQTSDAAISFNSTPSISKHFQMTKPILVTPNVSLSKNLCQISPVPTIPSNSGRQNQAAEVLTDSRIHKLREGTLGKRKTKAAKQSSDASKNKVTKCVTPNAEKNEEETNCLECWENYFSTSSKADWIKCSKCCGWLHETCTMYQDLCNMCGRQIIREKNLKRKK